MKTVPAPTPTPGTPASVREKMRRLREGFANQLPARLARARQLLESGEAPVELHRLLHGLKGTGRSLGFKVVGALAAEAEALAAVDAGLEVSTLPADARRVRLAGLLAAMEAQAVAPPPEPPPLPTLPDAQANAAEGPSRLVYVCDDEPAEVTQLCAQIACFGYQVEGYTDLSALRDAVARRKPDVFVMDICFPEGHDAGTETIGMLRHELGIEVPTVFLSARDDFDARLGAVLAGGEAYFLKPANLFELVSAMDGMTRRQEPDPYRVLIVDDDPVVAEYHSLVLRNAGMNPRLLTEPRRVLETLREFQPDMVLMDMYMPACTGRDLARLIRQVPDHVGLPIIFLSSETDKAKQFSAMRVGAEGFLTKPVVPSELAAAVAIRAERMRTLRGLMARDGLSGLYNHTTTNQLFEHALAAARRDGTPLCFAMIDIDRFKGVNDTHGHAAGDQVIVALSRLLQQRLRASDVIGRYGGEEFAVVLRDVPPPRAHALLDELRRDFARIPFHAAQGEFRCTFSAGLAGFPQHGEVESLRDAADKALYRAKRGGRDRVESDRPARVRAEERAP